MFADRLHQFFLPLLGENTSRRLILNYCSQANITPKDLTQDDLAKLGQYLAANIRAFVGAEQSNQIVSMLTQKANR